DDPMLGAVMMHLEAEDAAGLHHDVFHLHALARMDRAVGAPRAMNERMAQQLAAAALLEPGDDLLHVLRAIALRHHDGIASRDDNEIVDAQGGDKPLLGADIAILGILEDHVADSDIALAVLRAIPDLPQRVPSPDIAPAHLDRHDCGMRRVL